MTAKNLKPVRSFLQFQVLSPREIRQIHEAALEVMEEAGVAFPSQRALDILEEAGCRVDRETMVARLPAGLVMDCLRKVPSRYLLAGREPKNDLWIDGKASYLSTDGCCVDIYDLHTGKLRRSTKKDVTDVCRVADYLPEIAYVWGSISAQDVPPAARALHELEASMEGPQNTSNRRPLFPPGQLSVPWKWGLPLPEGGRP